MRLRVTVADYSGSERGRATNLFGHRSVLYRKADGKEGFLLPKKLISSFVKMIQKLSSFPSTVSGYIQRGKREAIYLIRAYISWDEYSHPYYPTGRDGITPLTQEPF